MATAGSSIGNVRKISYSDSVLIDAFKDKVAIGYFAGKSGQGDGAIAVGKNSGRLNQLSNAIAIGCFAGYDRQQDNAIGIGVNAGEFGQRYDAIAIGNGAGNGDQYSNAIAIGYDAGNFIQLNNAIAIGNSAGNDQQRSNAIALGFNAGKLLQNNNTIAIGTSAGQTYQNAYAVAIGTSAGQTYQNAYAVAIGTSAGQTSQNAYAVALGFNAGNSGQYSNAIAIGSNAGKNGQGAGAIAIGNCAAQTSQWPNSIMIDANNSGINPSQSGLYISPIRPAAATSNFLYYDTNGREITYGAGPPIPTLQQVTSAGSATNQSSTFSGNLTVNNLKCSVFNSGVSRIPVPSGIIFSGQIFNCIPIPNNSSSFKIKIYGTAIYPGPLNMVIINNSTPLIAGGGNRYYRYSYNFTGQDLNSAFIRITNDTGPNSAVGIFTQIGSIYYRLQTIEITLDCYNSNYWTFTGNALDGGANSGTTNAQALTAGQIQVNNLSVGSLQLGFYTDNGSEVFIGSYYTIDQYS
jgi:hypothetical protein